MEETDILDEEALISDDMHCKRKRYVRIIAMVAAVLFAMSSIIGFSIASATSKTGGQTWEAPNVEPSQETEENTESTTAPENDISASEPTEPEPNTDPVEPTKPSMPDNNDSKPTEPTKPTVPENVPSEPPVAPERGDYPIDPPQTDRERLACVIYQEAGGDAICDNCRRYVGDVVLNRVNDPRFPNTIEGVLLQSGQYGKFSWTGIVWQTRAQYAGEKRAVERAYRIADELLAGNHSELYGNGYVWQAGFAQGRDGFWHCGHFFGR